MRPLLLTILVAACSVNPAKPTLVEARAVELYADGASLDEVATDVTHGDRAAARDLVHRALIALQRRYYQDR
jgi:hypothetical protein